MKKLGVCPQSQDSSLLILKSYFRLRVSTERERRCGDGCLCDGGENTG